MALSDLRLIIGHDLRRYNVTSRFSFWLFIKYFYINVAPGIQFSVVFRSCQYFRKRNRLLFYFFYLWLRRIKYKFGYDISYRTKIGKGLYIGHFGGIVIHGDAEIGEFCNLSQGMTIGILIRGNAAGVPTIGDRVFMGPGSAILGGIKIGDDVLIGTNSVVTFDCPNKSVIAAGRSTIISDKGSMDYIGNMEQKAN